MKLNDITCKAAQPSDPPSKSPRKLADGEGLYLWVMPNGAKYWRIKHRFNQKPKELALGVYPEFSLKEAREKKVAARKLLADNKAPTFEKKKSKAISAQKSINIFEAIAREWRKVNETKWSDDMLKAL